MIKQKVFRLNRYVGFLTLRKPVLFVALFGFIFSSIYVYEEKESKKSTTL